MVNCSANPKGLGWGGGGISRGVVLKESRLKGGGEGGENQIIRLVHSALTSFGRIITPLARKFTSRLDSTFNGEEKRVIPSPCSFKELHRGGSSSCKKYLKNGVLSIKACIELTDSLEYVV